MTIDKVVIEIKTDDDAYATNHRGALVRQLRDLADVIDGTGTSGYPFNLYDVNGHHVGTARVVAPLFSVIEYASFFVVRHNPTGYEQNMGDGVDSLFDENLQALQPGTPGFVEAWADSLNADEETTLNAYFPDVEDVV